MKIIDLSRELYHRMPRLPNHPSIVITPFSTHDEVREADGYKFSSATMALAMGDHAGTHVDAPYHFDARHGALTIDQVPLENFFLDAVCLDLSHKPLKSDISIEDLQKAETAAGVSISPKDMVLLHMDFFRRCYGTDGLLDRQYRRHAWPATRPRPMVASALAREPSAHHLRIHAG